jgi:hypothetical protein
VSDLYKTLHLHLLPLRQFDADTSRQSSWRIDRSRTTSKAYNCSSLSYLHSDSRLQYSQPSILDIIFGSYISTGIFLAPSL